MKLLVLFSVLITSNLAFAAAPPSFNCLISGGGFGQMEVLNSKDFPLGSVDAQNENFAVHATSDVSSDKQETVEIDLKDKSGAYLSVSGSSTHGVIIETTNSAKLHIRIDCISSASGY